MAKSEKALDDLKKLYGKQAALNKDILAAEKAYASALKADVKVSVKPAKKAGAKKAPGRKAGAKKPAARKAPAKRKPAAVKPL
ncbi:hypothetical protein AGMMS4952_08880 [Spirochaetia bacterium]|nr:hypothetical protein AGMMS4952_08880 [Spirochaetia bacterium]